MNKIGSHVGVIASFSIFILFLAGIYIATQPVLSVGKDKEILLEGLWIETINSLSSKLTTTIVSNSTAFGGCLKVNNSDVGLIGNNFGAVVKTQSGNIYNSGFNGNNLIIQNNNERVLWIHYSREFPVNLTSDASCFSPKIESTRENDYMFEKKVFDAVNNFQSFKGNLSISEGDEFEIEFTLNNGSILSTANRKIEGDVFAKERKIQYVNGSSSVLSGELKIILI